MRLNEWEAERRYFDAYRAANATPIDTPAFEVAMDKLRVAWQQLQAVRLASSRRGRRAPGGAQRSHV
jgi:hypothetical protein